MTLARFHRIFCVSLLALLPFSLLSIAHAQGAKKTSPEMPVADADGDHVQERAEWFLRGRVVPGKSSAELRHRAYQAKMQARAARRARAQAAHADSQPPPPSGTWTAFGPVPLASDASAPIRFNRIITRLQDGLRQWRLILPIPAGTRSTSAEHRAECGSPPTPPLTTPTA